MEQFPTKSDFSKQEPLLFDRVLAEMELYGEHYVPANDAEQAMAEQIANEAGNITLDESEKYTYEFKQNV